MERVDDSFESETWSSTVHLDIASKRSLVGYLLRVTCTGRYALLDLTSVSADRRKEFRIRTRFCYQFQLPPLSMGFQQLFELGKWNLSGDTTTLVLASMCICIS